MGVYVRCAQMQALICRSCSGGAQEPLLKSDWLRATDLLRIQTVHTHVNATHKVDGLKAGKTSKHETLSDFDKGQTVTARRLGWRVSKTARLVQCSPYVAVMIGV